MTQPKDKHAFDIASAVLRAAGSSFHHYTPDNQERIMQACEKALHDALEAQHRETWARARKAAANEATHLNMETDKVSGHGYGDGRRDARWKIERLPCPPLEQPKESE